MAAAAVFASCAKEIQEQEFVNSEQQTLTEKLVGGTEGELVAGSLLIKMNEGALAHYHGRRGAFAVGCYFGHDPMHCIPSGR